MLSLFLRLYLILALALGLYTLGVSTLPNKVLKGTLSDYFQDLSRGSVQLILQRLEDIPVERWPEEVKRLSAGFGYPLSMLPKGSVELPTADMARLADGQATFETIGRQQVWYLPVAGTDLIAKVEMGQSDKEHGRRMTIGTFLLVEEELEKRPAEHWPARLEEIAGEFRFPLALLPLDDSQIDDEEREKLLAGEVLSYGLNTNRDWFLRRIGESDQVLKLGPMEDPWLIRVFAYIAYSILALLVALAAFVWLRPVWGGVLELRRVTAAFGRGELAARAAMPKRAPLSLLGQTFNQMAERIQRLVQSHRELTNAVSHELRTPIARLRFGTEMLGEAGNDADRQRFLAGMQDDIGELEALVDELLAFSRLERDNAELSTEQRPLGRWLSELCERESPPEGVRQQCLCADKPTQARFDPRLLGRAAGNLLRNAGKYAESRVTVDCELIDGWLSIAVEDDGPGVPEADRERVFEPFTRLDRSRDRETGGHGLGLAIARRVMQRHGGEALLEASSLGGARFLLRWPVTGDVHAGKAD